MSFPREAVRGSEPIVEDVYDPASGDYLGIQIIFNRFCEDTSYEDVFNQDRKRALPPNVEGDQPPTKKPKIEELR